jgi:predicted RNase H-like HicB family nuclease
MIGSGHPDNRVGLPMFVEITMRHQFTLEFWQDGPWIVGRLVEIPGVFSQGATLVELEENIQDAYEMMVS